MVYPATPQMSGKGLSTSTNASASSSVEKHCLNSKGKSVHGDSSPASTYGETSIGDSVPVTPNEAAGPSGEGGLSDLEAVLKDTPMERMWAKELAALKPTAEELAGILGESASPGSPEVFINLFADLLEDIAYDSEGNSRNAFRKKHGIEFVKGEGISNDPFVCTGSPSHKDTLSEKSSSLAAIDTARETPTSMKYRPRGDRALQEICSDNAQAVLPPNACVFIANLSNSLSDNELQRAVEDVFSQFGTVYVKIKRDQRGMPFAFAQYENAACAERAIEKGRGLVIHGRQCRTEQARVNRSLYLSTVNGKSINEAEARQILEGYGDLERVWHCSDTEKQMYRLSEGIWVMFAFFQDARDAQNKFKEIPQYSLENPQPGDGGSARGGSSSKTASSTWSNSPWGNQAVQVGNLPEDTTVEQVRALFDHVGSTSVVHVELSTRVIQGNVDDVSAIVTFRRHIVAESVLGTAYALGGNRLSLKICKWPRNDMRGPQRASSHSGSPPHRRRAQSHSQRDRAIAMGLNPAYVAAIFDAPTQTRPLWYNGMYNLGQPVLAQGNPTAQFPTYAYPSTSGSSNGNSQMYAGPSSMNDLQATYYNPLPGYPTTATLPYYPPMHAGYVYPQVANGHTTTSNIATDTNQNGSNGDQN